MQKYGVFETKYTSTKKKLCRTLPPSAGHQPNQAINNSLLTPLALGMYHLSPQAMDNIREDSHTSLKGVEIHKTYAGPGKC